MVQRAPNPLKQTFYSGADDEAYFSDIEIIKPGDPITFVSWSNPHPDTPAGDHAVLSIGGAAGNPAYYLYYQQANGRYMAKSLGATSTAQSNAANATVTEGEWIFTASRHAEDFAQVIQGKDVRNAGTVTTGALNVGRVAVGFRAGQNSSEFHGEIGPSAIYRTHLPDHALFRLADGEPILSVMPHLLIAAYLEGDGIDFSGNNYHLKKNGSPIPVTRPAPVRSFIPEFNLEAGGAAPPSNGGLIHLLTG